MFGSGKAKKPAAESLALPHSAAPTYIAQGVRIDGAIRGAKAMWVDGEIVGSVQCDETLTIGQTARVTASVHARKVVVNGVVEGDLYGAERVEILPEGRIFGNVTNPPGCLKVHEGAVVQGQCFTQAEPLQIESFVNESPEMLRETEPSTSQHMESS